MVSTPRVLYVTDLGYAAAGRRYCDEDIMVTGRLRHEFGLALCHPADAADLMPSFDVTVVRNIGPVIHFPEVYARFRETAVAGGHRVYNELTGKADMVGKQYLLDLTRDGHPVIPTVDDPADLDRLPACATYVVKPRLGADSVGLRFVPAEEVAGLDETGLLIQPRIDFRHEISFYFVDHHFQYALYAPDPHVRWRLEPYRPSAADLDFAHRFVAWNAISHGIQRIDACRTADGDLLLMEIEDLNPYLSLDLLAPETREDFLTAFAGAIREHAHGR